MERRDLSMESYGSVITDIESLRDGGYDRAGQWSLGQICKHLSYYQRGSLDGFSFKLPWIIRKLVGGPMLRKILRDKRMKPGVRTIPASVAGPEIDEAEAISECLQLLERLRTQHGELHPSPFFGELSPEQWESLHTLHAGHHLSFLTPKPA